MIVNGKLYTIIDEVENKPLPEKEECAKQKNEWYNKLNNIGEFRGWALSPKPSYNKFQIVSHILLAAKNNIKNIHILQVSGPTQVAVIFYICKKLNCFNRVTYDSSTFIRKGNGFKEMWITPITRESLNLGRETKIKQIDCKCPVCSKVKDKSLFFEASGRGSYLIALHNLYIMIQENEIFDKMSLNELEKYINNNLLKFINLIIKNPNKQEEIEIMFEKELGDCKDEIVIQNKLLKFF